jgi:large subunit ribosomal protein L23
VTEKSTLGKEQGQHSFIVAPWATKISVAQAVEKLFDVKVKAVNTMNIKGKKCRFGGRLGARSNLKKAIVSLEKGYNLNMEGEK